MSHASDILTEEFDKEGIPSLGRFPLYRPHMSIVRLKGHTNETAALENVISSYVHTHNHTGEVEYGTETVHCKTSAKSRQAPPF